MPAKLGPERMASVCGCVTVREEQLIRLMAEKAGTNRAQMIGKIVREWMEEHKGELPTLKEELEEMGQEKLGI